MSEHATSVFFALIAIVGCIVIGYMAYQALKEDI